MRILCCLILLSAIVCYFTPEAFSQTASDEQVKSLEIQSVKVINTKNRDKNQKIFIQVISDGYSTPVLSSDNLHKDALWTIARNYKFLDFVIVNVYENNKFNDKPVGSLHIDRDKIEPQNVVNLANDKISVELSYKIISAGSYNDFIQSMKEEVTKAELEVNSLTETRDQLRKDYQKLHDTQDQLETMSDSHRGLGIFGSLYRGGCRSGRGSYFGIGAGGRI